MVIDKSTQDKIKFMQQYKAASNAATGSQVDSNANITQKNIATLSYELPKKDSIQLQRAVMDQYLRKYYGDNLADQYIKDLEHHIIYRHDETSGSGGFPYCCAISLYPFLLEGLKTLGGDSEPPKHANSYIGGLINLIFLVAGQFAGACMYKDQKVLVRIDGSPYSLTSQQLFEKLATKINTFSTLTDTWEYSTLSNEIEIFEDNRWVPLKKVLRRPYTDNIYTITTKSGKTVQVSKDHKFKHLYRGQIFETKAENLVIGDTIFANYEFDGLIDKTSSDFKIGQIIGLIAGDGCIQDTMVSVTVNSDQEFIADFLDANLYLLNLPDCKHTRLLDARKNAKCFRYYIGSTKASDIIKTYFKAGCYSTFTKNIDLSDKSIAWQLGFLDGLLTADGSYSIGHCLTIALTNKGLLTTVQQILNNIYLYVNISETPAVGNKSAIYKCHIPTACLKFLDLVKKKPCYSSLVAYNNRSHINKTKTGTYYAGTTYGKTSLSHITCNSDHKLNLFTDVIVDIQKDSNDAEYVYEVETDTHWYNCGGLITHNCAVPEFLTYFDHFLRLDYGEDYINHLDDIIESWGNRKATLRNKIEDWFQQLIFTINAPASARGYQSVFINIAYFDQYYFKSIFKDFIFPDGDEPCWGTTKELQKIFMKWFNRERTKAVLTFPVESANILVENGKYKDEEMANFFAEMWSEGHSFFMYQSDSVDSLSSCCRLRNGVEENVFSTSMGAGGVETGSKAVITMNLNRIVQDWYKEKSQCTLVEYITNITNRVHSYLNAFNYKLWDDYNAGILTVYNAGYIQLDKQFLTCGVNSFVEAAEFLSMQNDTVYNGIKIDPDNPQYRQLSLDLLGTIESLNKLHRTEHCKYNLECVPGENASAKLYNWDKRDGYWVPNGRNLYNSYFYVVEDPSIDPVKKFYYQGTGFADICSGGVALHNNLDSHLSQKQYRALMDIAVKAGCNYFTFNIPNTICNDCGHISKYNLDHCPECGSTNIDKATRIIGYLRRISNFSEARQEEASRRYYAREDTIKIKK